MTGTQAELLRSSSNRKLVIAGQIAFLPTGILTTLLGPMLPILIVRWALNDTQAGNLFLVQFLASVVGVQLSVFCCRGWVPSSISVGAAVDGGWRRHALYGIALARLASVAAYGLGLGLIIPTDSLLIAEISAGSGLTSSGSSRTSAVSLLNVFWGVERCCVR